MHNTLHDVTVVGMRALGFEFPLWQCFRYSPPPMAKRRRNKLQRFSRLDRFVIPIISRQFGTNKWLTLSQKVHKNPITLTSHNVKSLEKSLFGIHRPRQYEGSSGEGSRLLADNTSQSLYEEDTCGEGSKS